VPVVTEHTRTLPVQGRVLRATGARRRILLRAQRLVCGIAPAAARKGLVVAVNRMSFVPNAKKEALSLLLLHDIAKRDNAALHKYLWANHLAYASYYEPRNRLGDAAIESSRRTFFADMQRCLERIGALESCHSVLELGCSLGFNLRYLETTLFSTAEHIHGVDLDNHAIQEGRRYLHERGSRIELFQSDVEGLDDLLGDRGYDVVFCCGLLLYFDQPAASALVGSMLRHARVLVGITSVPNALVDNRLLESSGMREWDTTHIHNVDDMVASAGRVIGRRHQTGLEPAYFVFARPVQRRREE
jgi:SAM-dependent methyltransferase